LWKLGELVKPLEDPMSLLGEIVYLGDFGVAIKADDEVDTGLERPWVIP
jgi:hypothetical protein